MGWGLWNTLLRPDGEELQNPEKTAIARAANCLQVGEFQLLQLAYREWYGEDLPVEQIDELFRAYMIDSEVPPWARHYARQILLLADRERLDDNQTRYHRYDHDYRSVEPNGIRKFIFAVSCLLLFVGGSILLANATTREAASIFPPYFENEKAAHPPAVDDGYGRADSVRVFTVP